MGINMLLQKVLRATNCGRTVQRVVRSRIIRPIYKQKENSAQSIGTIWITSSFFGMGMWGLAKIKDEKETQITTREVVLAKADALYDQGDYKSIYELLSNYKDSKDVEILWRLCRAIYNISKTTSDVEARKLTYEGYDLLCIALDIKEDHFAVHKWMSIFLDNKSTLEGVKARINQSHNIKKHILRASELNPNDAMLLYMLGCWCYEISNFTWYQRKIASVIFAEPPTSNFEEALTYYEKAEKVDPNFYSHNLLMLGKTYLKLNRKEEAVKYLKKTVEFLAKNDEDQKAKQEAQKILSSI